MDQDQCVLQHALHPLGVGDEVRGEISAIEPHSLDHFERRLHGLGFLDRNDAVLADLFHGLGNDVADGGIVVGGHRAHLRDHRALNRLRDSVELALDVLFVTVLAGLIVAANRANRAFDTALHVHRVGAGGHGLRALAENRLGQHGRGGGAVARNVGSLGSDLTHHLRAHVLERVRQADFLRHRYPILGDRRGAEFLV